MYTDSFYYYVDKPYLEVAETILQKGSLKENRTGIKAYKLPHVIMEHNLEKGLIPILETKFVAFKTALKELLWIWQKQSNDVRELQSMGVHVWDEWMREDGTIGKAYGYQLRKYNQVDKLLDTLKNNPNDRRMVVTMWNNEDLNDMALQPCAYETIWDVTNGKLNCMLIQRSGDWGLGIPFNMTQYGALVHMIAHCTGLEAGKLTHVINNAHIYVNHVEAIIEQLRRWHDDAFWHGKMTNIPHIEINPDVTDFYKLTADDIKLVGYEHQGKLHMDVAV